MKQRGRQALPLGLLIALLAGALILLIIIAASLGSSSLDIKGSFLILSERIPVLKDLLGKADYADNYRTIVFDIRLPRIILSVLAGAALALVGSCFQSMFRNQLADPHILGVSSGAALGATVALIFGLQGSSLLGLGGMGLFAFIFALATVSIVYLAAGEKGSEHSITTMLLIGVALSTLFSSIISLLMMFNHEQIARVYMWTLGSFSAATWAKVRFILLIFVPCAAYLLTQGKVLNLLMAGEEEALSLGLDAGKKRKRLIFVSSLLIAATVSVSGIIGFVGLVVPQYLRIMGEHDMRRQVPLSLLLGAIFTLLCDTLARTILVPAEIPVGIITSLFGVPYFLYVIIKRRMRGY